MILLIGTISNTLTGPVGALMAMTNNEHGVMTQNFLEPSCASCQQLFLF